MKYKKITIEVELRSDDSNSICEHCKESVIGSGSYAIITLLGGEEIYAHHTVDKDCYWKIKRAFH
jgi:hypothetical protein